MLATGPGGGMFGNAGKSPAINGGMRGKSNFVDEDDDDDDDNNNNFGGNRAGNGDDNYDDDDRIGGYKEKAISLDQARRIATQSVFRAGRF